MQYNDNPFKILGVSPSTGRREIVRQAEERSLLSDAEKCADARAVLTNPQKRLSAEIHWFLDCGQDEINDIDLYISDVLAGNGSEGYAWGTCNPLTQLNIQLACISAQDFENTNSAKYYILGLSRLFEAINVDDVLSMINQERSESGFPEVMRKQDVEESLSVLRAELRQSVSQKLQDLATDKYVQIVTMLSESYSGNDRYKGHAVLEDLIADYQLFINDTLQNNGRDIIDAADRIALSADQMDVEDEVDRLIAKLYDWDKYAQPLQLGALTKGSAHELSKDLLQKLRGLALKLHNQFELTSESLKITKAIQTVFQELPEYSDLLSNDSETLTRLVAEQGLDERMAPVMEEIETSFDDLLDCQDEDLIPTSIKMLVSKVSLANGIFKNEESDEEFSDLLRTELFMRVRSLAIMLHNDHKRTADAYRIICEMEPFFSDLPEICKTIEEDTATLSSMLQQEEQSNKIINEMEAIEQSLNGVKNALASDRQQKVEKLISRMVKLDGLIKASVKDSETQKSIRERLAYMVRSVGVALHNEKRDSENALRIMTAVKKEFPDIPSLQGTLDKEILTLYQMTGGFSRPSSAAIERQKQKDESPGTKKFVAIALAALALIVVGIKVLSPGASNNGTSNTNSPTASVSTPKPAATPKPTLTPQEMPASGAVLYCADSYTPSTFTVRNNGSSNYYMKFVTAGTDSTVITFFVREHSTVTVDIPAGNLELRYAYGSTWYGESKLFGDETRYAKDEEPYDFSNYTWEISLYTTTNEGETMDVEEIDANEF